MKLVAGRLILILGVMALSGCSNFVNWAFAIQPRNSETERKIETVTGQVVLVGEGYRFRTTSEADGNVERLRRLTKSKRGNADYPDREIHLRKYYGKTLTVQGELEPDWITEAHVIGQWLRPGEPTGPNVNAPPDPGASH